MRRPDPVEVVAIGLPIMLEAFSVLGALAGCAVWVALRAGA